MGCFVFVSGIHPWICQGHHRFACGALSEIHLNLLRAQSLMQQTLSDLGTQPLSWHWGIYAPMCLDSDSGNQHPLGAQHADLCGQQVQVDQEACWLTLPRD